MPAPRFDRPDAIIVGSGAGGGTAAHALTARGFTVTVLEKGEHRGAESFLPLDELHFHARKTLIPQVNVDPQIYAGLDGKQHIAVERWWEANGVGGSTLIWDANFPRYTREDFEVLSVLKDVPRDANMVNWPWTYDEFQRTSSRRSTSGACPARRASTRTTRARSRPATATTSRCRRSSRTRTRTSSRARSRRPA
jgi:choline dehydrogenase-like flavoprotein